MPDRPADRPMGRCVVYLYTHAENESIGEHVIWWDQVIDDEFSGLPLEVEWHLDTKLPKGLGFWIWEGWFEQITNDEGHPDSRGHGEFRRPSSRELGQIPLGNLGPAPGPTSGPTSWERLNSGQIDAPDLGTVIGHIETAVTEMLDKPHTGVDLTNAFWRRELALKVANAVGNRLDAIAIDPDSWADVFDCHGH